MSAVIASKDPCPLCLLQNSVYMPLMDTPGQFETKCRAGHKFNDTEELNVLRTQAKAKFPQHYKGAAPPSMPTAAERLAQDIILTAEIKKTIEDMIGGGIVITSPSDVKGLIFGYFHDNKDKDAEIRRLTAMVATMRRNSGGPGQAAGANQISVELPEWAIQAIADQAEHTGMKPQDWIAQEFTAYIENYFNPTVGRQSVGGPQ